MSALRSAHLDRRSAAPVVLLLLGLFGISEASGYGLWESGGPGAGLLPGLSSIALCVFSAAALFEHPAPAEPASLPRLAGYVAGLLGFAFLMGQIGAIAAVVVLFCWSLWVVERWPLRRVAPLALGAALFAWVLFERLLQVPLPRGVFG